MRVCSHPSEWYSWHFPELVKIVNDNILYARCALAIGNREEFDEDEYALLRQSTDYYRSRPCRVFRKLQDITNDEEKARLVIAAAKTSMGYTISEFDIRGLTRFAERVVHLSEYRENLADYLHDKYAWNTSFLGEVLTSTG